jgi:hypothetical protein
MKNITFLKNIVHFHQLCVQICGITVIEDSTIWDESIKKVSKTDSNNKTQLIMQSNNNIKYKKPKGGDSEEGEEGEEGEEEEEDDDEDNKEDEEESSDDKEENQGHENNKKDGKNKNVKHVTDETDDNQKHSQQYQQLEEKTIMKKDSITKRKALLYIQSRLWKYT